jgi:hypothetical protein
MMQVNLLANVTRKISFLSYECWLFAVVVVAVAVVVYALLIGTCVYY